MKGFESIRFDSEECRRELERFQALLGSKDELSERDDLQPLFRVCRQLTALIGTNFPDIGLANRLAYEFPMFGDYAADIVIGNSERSAFCAIELEDARPNSIFKKVRNRSTAEWSARFAHGFGQVVDWFFALDDQKGSHAFEKHFGNEYVRFFGMLLVGRSADLTDSDRTRFRWWSDRVTVNTHKVACWTYDELYEALNREWRFLSFLAAKESSMTKLLEQAFSAASKLSEAEQDLLASRLLAELASEKAFESQSLGPDDTLVRLAREALDEQHEDQTEELDPE